MDFIIKKFDLLVVLGKNWENYPPRFAKPENWQIQLSPESKISALAGAEMLRAGLTEKVIFVSGKTAGKIWPSEARAMLDFIKSSYSGATEENFILEEESFDTAGNAEKIAELLKFQKPRPGLGFQDLVLKRVALMTIGYHLPRALRIFREYGMNLPGFASETELVKLSLKNKYFVDYHLSSLRYKLEVFKEMALFVIQFFDRKGKFLRHFSKLARHIDSWNFPI